MTDSKDNPPGERPAATISRPAQETPRRAIWLASYPKSGNTWTRVFLNNLMRELDGGGAPAQDINALGEWTNRELTTADFRRVLGRPAHEASPAEIAKARSIVQAHQVQRRRGPVFIKTHNAVANVEGFPTVNFDVTLAGVYIVRNPLDVAVSYAHHSATTTDYIIEHMADAGAAIDISDPSRVYEFISSWSFHAASWISVTHRPVLILRYEDMLAAPEKSFRKLAGFLRLKPTVEQLNNAIRNSSFENLTLQEATQGFREKPEKSERFFRVGRAGQWREALSRKQLDAILSVHSPMMMRFGYLNEAYELAK